MRFAQISNLLSVYPALALSVLFMSMSCHARRSHTGKRIRRLSPRMILLRMVENRYTVSLFLYFTIV